MPISFDRSICCDLSETITREWLITNGLGGYAAGTVVGALTRMQHGLLVASPLETAAPQLLLAKIDEEVLFDQRTYYLGTNEYRDGTLNPSGFGHLETFRLEEGFPVFTYLLDGIDGIMLEKRIWMPYGYNTTCIQYRVLPGPATHEAADRGGWQGSGCASPTHQTYARYHGYSEAAQNMLELTLLPFSAYRPHHLPQYGNNDWYFQVEAHQAGRQSPEQAQQQEVALPQGVAGCTIRAWEGAHPYHIFVAGHPESHMTFIPTGVWYWHFLRRQDAAAGLTAIDDLYLPGVFKARLWPGEDAVLTFIVTAEELSSLTFSPGQLTSSYKRSVERQRGLLRPQRYFGEGGESAYHLRVLPIPTAPDPQAEGQGFLRALLQGGDHFLAQRLLPLAERSGNQPLSFSEARTTPRILSDYYAMEDGTREMLIALPGLTLVTGRFEEASRLLRSLARYFRQGMLPDQLPPPGRALTPADYRSVDTTLWYFYALDQYVRVTGDYGLVAELYQRLAECIQWYTQGTYHTIRVDPADGLLRADEPGKALTWMNATVHDAPVTPRGGKPVEVNALWYHALALMDEWSQQLQRMGRAGHATRQYQEQCLRCKESFQQRFWYEDGGYLYDVVDGPAGNDSSLRPNQLLALSLRHQALTERSQRRVFEVVTRHLLTPHGIRSLAPADPAYRGRLPEVLEAQPQALHQGSAWAWLLGPYIDALLNRHCVAGSPALEETPGHEQARHRGVQLLEPFRAQLSQGILSMVGSAFDGDAPHTPGYLPASAASTGEILRAYYLLAHAGTKHQAHAVSL